ncbi:MAG: hypothetical protein IMF12_08825, partial [Proteobacteria bacterium]|nr:hypothetical protein [Pseudomonadota bacterium]
RFISISDDTTLKTFDATNKIKIAEKQQIKKEYFSQIKDSINQISHQK